VAVFLFSIITEKWNALTAVFSSPHFPELYSTRPRNRSANVPVNTCQQFTLKSSGEKMKRKQNIEFFMRILNLFLDFRSDVRFRRNDGFKIARFFLSCMCLRIGRQMTYYDYTPTVHFRVIWRKNEENTKHRVFNEDSESVFGFSIGCTVLTQWWF
jgi:hypothetical protein